jgi:transposase
VTMRGDDQICGKLFSYRDREERVRADHRLRPIRKIANAALAALSGEFAALYCAMGGPSVPPEKLLRAMLLQAFYSVRSERQLMERIEFDLLFHWFVGIDDRVWDHSTFTENRDRLLGARSPANSSTPFCRSRGSSGCCGASISRSTGR